MDKILHDAKDPKLWELWYIPYNGSCRILSINLIKSLLDPLDPRGFKARRWPPGGCWDLGPRVATAPGLAMRMVPLLGGSGEVSLIRSLFRGVPVRDL